MKPAPDLVIRENLKEFLRFCTKQKEKMKKSSNFQPVITFTIVLLTIIIFLQGAVPFSPVYADDDSTGGLVPCNNKCTLCHILIGMQNIFQYLMGLLFVATMFFVTLNGALMMVSAGSQKIIGQVKTALGYCWKGFLLFLICWVIITAILKTLGYRQLDNWWQFECDTTQTEGPAPTKTDDKEKGRGEFTGKGCRGIVANAEQMEGWTYSQPNRNQNGYSDCSSLVRRTYEAAGCTSPGNTTADMYPKATEIGDRSSLRAGDAIIYPGHVMICKDDGCNQIIHASSGAGRVLTSNSSWAFRKYGNTLRVLRASNYCKDCI